LPVVNIGDRQKGRVRAKNVIDVNVCNRKNISEAIKTAVSEVFVASIRDVENPYGKGNMSRDIIEKLKNITLSNSLIQKGFCVIR
ncbi:MAG: UDP-N-acetylglucosamine 2-epimerase, partial [Prolixibacteraceae bacterium]|nr:UDP-N-acetylglucosamine 2-epimerase [Prolixibacteraceae bacterium]